MEDQTGLGEQKVAAPLHFFNQLRVRPGNIRGGIRQRDPVPALRFIEIENHRD
jgi:hypothetical protein